VYTVIGKVTPKAISVEEIQQRVSLMMINEAAHCLQKYNLLTRVMAMLVPFWIGFPTILRAEYLDILTMKVPVPLLKPCCNTYNRGYGAF
jgi:hypothetical protein